MYDERFDVGNVGQKREYLEMVDECPCFCLTSFFCQDDVIIQKKMLLLRCKTEKLVEIWNRISLLAESLSMIRTGRY